MNKSTDTYKRYSIVCLAASVTIALGVGMPIDAEAGLLRGAVGGAIIGGILGGDDGAEAGAIIGGIGGAMEAGARRSEQRRRRQAYEQQEMQRRREMEQERLRLERERNEILRQQQAAAATPPQSADTQLVRQVQSALTLLGFDVGPADGSMNDATVDAIRSYQQSFGLLATGAPSAELLEHMKQNL